MTARWPPQQIPPLNFLGCHKKAFYDFDGNYTHKFCAQTKQTHRTLNK